MISKRITGIFFFLALIVYNYLFWDQKTGINLPLFTLFLSGILFVLHPHGIQSPKVWIGLGGVLLSGLMVFMLNTYASKFAHYVSFIILAGFIHEQKISTVYTSGLIIISNLFKTPPVFSQELAAGSPGKVSRVYKTYLFLRLSIFPFLAFICFYILYATANPIFSAWSNIFWDNFSRFLSLSHFLFLAGGFFVLGAIIYKRKNNGLINDELGRSNFLFRVRNPFIKRPTEYNSVYYSRDPAFMTLGLKNENRMGCILLVAVNFLLLIDNIIDVNRIWFDFRLPADSSLKEFVHRGTELLILSILLSMAILLYLFRGNQNFYSRSTLLKKLACLWICQNIILSISVWLRNGYYIGYHGLAYLRIGVFVFLVLVIFGLLTLFIKIIRVKSFFYLLRLNTWALYFAVLGLSFVSWDVVIANYNINHSNPAGIDVDFYLQLSDKALPFIDLNLPKIEHQVMEHNINGTGWGCSQSFDDFKKIIKDREYEFEEDHKKYGWPSFNLADRNIHNYLTTKIPPR